MEKPPGIGGGDGRSGPSSRFSQDISGMPEEPPRNLGHRRAHSEILTLPDDLSFDGDLGFVGGPGGGDVPSHSDDIEDDFFSMYFDMDKFGSATSPSADPPAAPPATAGSGSLEPASGTGERPRGRHQHSQSMDGSTTSVKSEMLASSSGSEGGASLAETKKAMSAAKLADLSLIDPKRAKRIWANRQSAARSKERKMRYIQELERKVQTLQTEATTLSAQMAMLQRDTNGLTAENNELKLRLQTMEQQVHLQDALNDALREEVQRLKLATGQLGAGQVIPNGGQMMSFGPSPFGTSQQFYHPNNAAMQSLLAAHQLQQLQIHSQHQQQLQSHHSQLQHQHQQQSPADLKMKGVMNTQNQREGPSESHNTPKE